MGQICRNELQENPLSELMFSEHVGSSKDSQRFMGNHQAHTSPFWLQFVLTWKDMEMFHSGFWDNTQEFSLCFS